MAWTNMHWWNSGFCKLSEKEDSEVGIYEPSMSLSLSLSLSILILTIGNALNFLADGAMRH